MAIKSLFFDLGGTLLDISCCITAVETGWASLGLPDTVSPHLFAYKWIETGQRLQCGKTFSGPRAVFDLSAEAMSLAFSDVGLDPGTGVPLALTRMAWDSIRRDSVPFPDATAFLFKELRSLGYSLGIITDSDEDVLREVMARIPARELLDPVIASYRVGVTKPAPEIFRYALDKVGATPEEAIMVGDSRIDALGAQGVAMKCILVERGGAQLPALGPIPCIRSLAELPTALKAIDGR